MENNSNNLKSSTLAPVQRQTLEFLRNFIAEKGYAPPLRAIADHIGVKSVSTAHFHLERLEQKGFIHRGDDGSINISEVTTSELGPTVIPLVGVIAAGVPIEAIENTTMIEVPSSMLSRQGELYALEVSGDSMIGAHICDKDIVLIRKQNNANDDDTVVALFDDGNATLKKYRRLRNGKIMLIPANPALSPITVDKVTVQGIVVGLLRNYH